MPPYLTGRDRGRFSILAGFMSFAFIGLWLRTWLVT